MDQKCHLPDDTAVIEDIVNRIKRKGIFDAFRHECLADVDTKSSCQNLSQRVDGYTSKYLGTQTWHTDLNKNESRNKLRRHISESGMLAIGADIVAEQVITPKIHQLLHPTIIDFVDKYVKEQNELQNKKPEATVPSESFFICEKPFSDTSESKDKAQISDPIADILSFSYSKSKTSSVISAHVKTETVQHKHGETSKVEKKKEEKNALALEKNTLEVQGESIAIPVSEIKAPLEKEKDKVKKEDPDIHQEVLKKILKDEMKSEKKKTDDVKTSISENVSASEESKSSVPVSSKPNISLKKDDKNKHKSKSQNTQKSSSSSSEAKKPKKESFEKSSEKLNKSKPTKSPKELPSPTKVSSLKSVFKDEKGENSKSKSHDAGSSKISESSMKKSKSNYGKKDSNSLKHKGQSEKTDKLKASKSLDKNESHIHHDTSHIHHDSSNSEKSSKGIHYSSSYESSQGSDQEKNTSTNLKNEKPKHFSKHANKEKLEHPDTSNKVDKKRSNDDDESPSKKYKNEKDAKLKLKDISAVEAAKICSRSNSLGSTSSVSSSSNASKENLTSNSDEVSENSVTVKKKKQPKEKDSCQNSPKTLPPPPPPPPPPSSSLTSELTSSAEMSSVEDSLSGSETSGSEEISDESSSDLELESKELIHDTLNENALNSSTDNINAFYDIFLYSSSSSEFEGYGNSPEKKFLFENELKDIHHSDISISSVHTSDLSSFDDELSSDDDFAVLTGGTKKRLTLKEAQELIENRISLASLNEKKKVESETYVGEDSINKRSSSFMSSDDESPPSEPKRSLRRERKLNPRYSSSEYTSIFNCKKESFITKQTSPPVKSQIFTTSPKIEPKLKKNDSVIVNTELFKECLEEAENVEIHPHEIKISEENKNKFKTESQEDDQLSDNKMSSSDEIDSIMDKEKLFKENNKNNLISDDDKLKDHKKLKPYNNSKLKKNSHSLKRKLEVTESTPVKRPCSRSSVDSSSSEFASNENKPFNNEKNNFHEEKKLNDCNLKVSNLTVGVKKDLFCKQRTNNNGDILGQKDAFPKNSLNKVINNSEMKTNESDTSEDLCD